MFQYLIKEVYEMTNNEKHDIKIDKSDEPRTKEISKMIGEGGLGADKYYEIEKGDWEKKDDEGK